MRLNAAVEPSQGSFVGFFHAQRMINNTAGTCDAALVGVFGRERCRSAIIKGHDDVRANLILHAHA